MITAGIAPARMKGGLGPLSTETARLYAGDWAVFQSWCRDQDCPPLPAAPATVAAFLGACAARLSPGALARRVAAITDQHRQHGHPSPAAHPAVKAVLREARRARSAPRRPLPRPSAQLVRMAAACSGDLAGLRDQALLLLAAMGFGRAALVGLDAEGVRFTAAGVDLVVRDRLDEADGTRMIAVAHGATFSACPVRALEHWLRASECRFGPVFRKVDRWGDVVTARSAAANATEAADALLAWLHAQPETATDSGRTSEEDERPEACGTIGMSDTQGDAGPKSPPAFAGGMASEDTDVAPELLDCDEPEPIARHGLDAGEAVAGLARPAGRGDAEVRAAPLRPAYTDWLHTASPSEGRASRSRPSGPPRPTPASFPGTSTWTAWRRTGFTC